MSMEIAIVLVEDEYSNQKTMSTILHELFPNCLLEIKSTGIRAIDYLLSPANKYDLVILGGNLKSHSTLVTCINGPDVAAAMKEQGIVVPVVLWTNDASMLEKFDAVYGKRLPEVEKPARKFNIEVILKPIVQSIIEGLKEFDELKQGMTN